MKDKNMDEVTGIIGEWGPWQFRIFSTVSFTAAINAFHLLAMAFYAPDAQHWCKPPPNTIYANWTTQQWKNYSLPFTEKNSYSQCLMYDRNYSDTSDVSNTALSTVECRFGWEYDRSTFVSTVENEWDLVCSREVLAKTGSSLFFAGVMVGSLIFGQVSDTLGRKTALLLAVLLSCVPGVMVSFVSSLSAFLALRFFIAMGVVSGYMVGFVLIMESVDGKHRTWAGIGNQFFWCFGYMVVTGLAYVLDDWRTIQLVISVAVIPLLSYWWIIPESPRWLLSQGRKEEAYKTLIAAALENGKMAQFSSPTRGSTTRKGSHASLSDSIESDDVKGRNTFLDLFKHPSIRRKTLVMYYNWFALSFTYYGLTLGASSLGGDIFGTFFLSAIVEVASLIFTIVVLLNAGCRLPLTVLQVLGGLACLSNVAFDKGVYINDWPIVTVAMLGKFCVSAAFAVLFVYAAELFPTVVRNVGIGSSNVVGRIGAILAPYVDLTRHIHPSIPLIIFGTICIVAGLLVLLLPETHDKPVPQTIEEQESSERESIVSI